MCGAHRYKSTPCYPSPGDSLHARPERCEETDVLRHGCAGHLSTNHTSGNGRIISLTARRKTKSVWRRLATSDGGPKVKPDPGQVILIIDVKTAVIDKNRADDRSAAGMQILGGLGGAHRKMHQ
ncbi:hypothetical protein BV898_19045 [Hypsibius exemplaris]|uniref:Uncharacterized protein n=1 Tax=Hypsibius exemplaris TaxID=2072580 RepID=A0A9X6NKZ0_HYPEX|nr:hypothetical protein BV898_19045 [Hypsibius exemplaris]